VWGGSARARQMRDEQGGSRRPDYKVSVRRPPAMWRDGVHRRPRRHLIPAPGTRRGAACGSGRRGSRLQGIPSARRARVDVASRLQEIPSAWRAGGCGARAMGNPWCRARPAAAHHSLTGARYGPTRPVWAVCSDAAARKWLKLGCFFVVVSLDFFYFLLTSVLEKAKLGGDAYVCKFQSNPRNREHENLTENRRWNSQNCFA